MHVPVGIPCVVASLWVILSLLAGPTVAGERFRRGNANSDATIDLGARVFILFDLFREGASAPTCEDAANLNDDGTVNISDPVFGRRCLFVAGSPPPTAPGPKTPGFDGTPNDPFDCGDFDNNTSPVTPTHTDNSPVGLAGLNGSLAGEFAVGVSGDFQMGVVIDPETGRTVGECSIGENPGLSRIRETGESLLVTNFRILADPATDVASVNRRDPSRPVTQEIEVGARFFDLAWATPRFALALTQGTLKQTSDIVTVIDGELGENLGETLIAKVGRSSF